MPFFEASDLLVVGVLVLLEAVLSADNALVLAVMVLPLPEEQRRKALQYGIIGAFILRGLATLLALQLVQVRWVTLLGGLYLLYLPIRHFMHQAQGDRGTAHGVTPAHGILGLSLFWTTVARVEITDLVFAVDSILVAVAMTSKPWVIITGGVLGILAMRLVVIQVIALIRRYPKLIDGAYLVVFWVGVKLVWEYLHLQHLVPVALPKPVAIGGVILIFIVSYLYARAHAARHPVDPAAHPEHELLSH